MKIGARYETSLLLFHKLAVIFVKAAKRQDVVNLIAWIEQYCKRSLDLLTSIIEHRLLPTQRGLIYSISNMPDLRISVTRFCSSV